MSENLSVWIPGDQLLRDHPAVRQACALASGGRVTVVLVESARRFGHHPYHRKKSALIRSAMRHYAVALEAQGVTVDYQQAETVGAGLRAHALHVLPTRVLTMEASEYRGRQWQHQRMAEATGVPVDVVPATQFLFQQYNPFPRAEPDQRVIMEAFYRRMRRHFRVLMDGDEPAGGVWNTDKQNRRPLPTGLTAPRRLSFAPDAITQAALDESAAANGFGDVTGFDWAVTHDEATAALTDFVAHRLPSFGAYEDAMTRHDGQVFHSLLSPYLNIGLLEPMQVIRAAEAAYVAGHAPLNSAEGFIRQVLGWREFMAWQYWRQMPSLMQANAWDAHRPLPEFFWSGETPMNCLHHVLERARRDGYAHHIERLMLLTNFATLAGLEPVEVNHWFLSAFVDAYEWVMIPNVLGMGLNADGGRTATKPYIASANYISRMSDYCADCPFDPAARTGDDACPFNALYWNFLITHEQALRSNPRFGPAVLGLNRLDDAERQRVQAQAAAFLDGLTPAALR